MCDDIHLMCDDNNNPIYTKSIQMKTHHSLSELSEKGGFGVPFSCLLLGHYLPFLSTFIYFRFHFYRWTS